MTPESDRSYCSACAIGLVAAIVLAVQTAIADVPGDIDGSGRVDPNDVGLFAGCMTGPDVITFPPGCGAVLGGGDLDIDQDLDMHDFAALSTWFGSYAVFDHLPADPNIHPAQETFADFRDEVRVGWNLIADPNNDRELFRLNMNLVPVAPDGSPAPGIEPLLVGGLRLYFYIGPDGQSRFLQPFNENYDFSRFVKVIPASVRQIGTYCPPGNGCYGVYRAMLRPENPAPIVIPAGEPVTVGMMHNGDPGGVGIIAVQSSDAQDIGYPYGLLYAVLDNILMWSGTLFDLTGGAESYWAIEAVVRDR